MIRRPPAPSPEVRSLLEQERPVPPLPSHVRARSLERARAALVAGRVMPPTGFSAPRSHPWGVALAAACIASVAVGATAYQLGAHRHATDNEHPAASPSHAEPARPSPPPENTAVEAPASASAAGIAQASSAARRSPSRSASRAPVSSQAAPAPGELRLLEQARAAVARGDFAAALAPIAEHARRFKKGRLAEEREALRVKALSGLGRTEEARHAAHAFEKRFPRSVLLPAVGRMPSSEP